MELTISQSKPDGYTLSAGCTWVSTDGCPEDKEYSLKRTTSGTMFTISNLGGLEKGKNIVGIALKGTIGDTITINWGGIKTSTFLVDAEGINYFTDTLIIPYTTDFITIVGTATVVTSQVNISGLKLHK